MNIDIKVYDYDAQEAVFSELFFSKDIKDTEDGMREIPAASYQLLISGLEQSLWLVPLSAVRDNREIIRQAIGILESARNRQKRVEFERRYNKE